MRPSLSLLRRLTDPAPGARGETDCRPAYSMNRRHILIATLAVALLGAFLAGRATAPASSDKRLAELQTQMRALNAAVGASPAERGTVRGLLFDICRRDRELVGGEC